jgi:serine/threonine protein kinase
MKYCPTCKAKYADGVIFCAVEGEVLEDDPSSIVNTVLDGQYHIESMLGKGGMGAVFLARHILLGDRVAIKVLPPEMRSNSEWLRRFRREGQAARRFRHPNAVTVYDLRTAADGTIYLVMEYVDGHTLYVEMNARGRFTPAEAVSALDPIMSVLNEAHAMGVVHRDLKPENIMFGKAGTGGMPQVKLLDLGIAKLREVAGGGSSGDTALTMAGQMLGTPYYMSPEQWGELPQDGNPEIDGRADIYSLGLVFYEMIAGKRPYSALTLLELRKEHVSVIARRLDEVVPTVPHGFSDVIARAMAKDRGDRPATAADLATELKAALSTAGSAPSNFIPSSVVAGSALGSSQAPTITIAKASQTASDVNAPTIVETGSALAERPTVSTALPRVTANVPPAVPLPDTIVESGSRASSITAPGSAKAAQVSPPVPQVAAPAVVQPAVQPVRNGFMSVLIGGVVLLILIALGAGAFLLLPQFRGGSTTVNTPGPAGNGNNSGPGPALSTKEAARYWLEISAKPEPGHTVRVAPLVPVASGQYFKLHFTPTDDGYLYIIGPGIENAMTAFLTAKPSLDSGLATNDVRKGVDFVFPAGDEHWLGLDKKPGAEEYTLVFSRTPLSEPKFLSAQANPSHPLNDSDKIELTAFFAKYKTGAQTIESNTANGPEPYVVVKVPVDSVGGNPLVFDVRIQHR